jgi:hypothetical protein
MIATQNEHGKPPSSSTPRSAGARSDDAQPYSNKYRWLMERRKDRADRASAPEWPPMAGPVAAPYGPGVVLAGRYRLLDLLG